MSADDKQIIYHFTVMGCDPELFFEQDGKVIGAEKVIDEKGLSSRDQSSNCNDYLPLYYGRDKHFVRDGVQIELNPAPHSCRANMGNEIKCAMKALRSHLKAMQTDIKASFRSVVEVDRAELNSLSEKSRVLGCQPSNNLYDSHATVSVDPVAYNKRSAGGHIHIGLAADPSNCLQSQLNLMKRREMLVPLMDVLVGLPSVMVDRDPLAAERRKVYGRAGEYRLPKHGLEYRTLSNFWLRSYQLMSFVFGLTRLAVSVLGTEHYSHPYLAGHSKAELEKFDAQAWPAATTLLSTINIDKVKEAINQNDLELALEQFQHVKHFLLKHVAYGDYGLNGSNVAAFEKFCQIVSDKGLTFYFPQDPLEHWCNMPEGHAGTGWEAFMRAVSRGEAFRTTY